MNRRSDGWFEEWPAATAFVHAAGLPTYGQLPTSGDRGPLIGGGIVASPIEDLSHVHTFGLVFPMAEAGRLIGALYEWASRNGLEYALQSAVDQGRAWARSAPRS